MTPELVHAIRHATEGRPCPPSESPWLIWLTVALCRQRARQDWLARVARERLDPWNDTQGQVPGLPSWQFDFHGEGLCLTGPNNEVLDVDLYADGEGPQTIDPHFFVSRVLSLQPRPRLETRVAAWFSVDRGLLIEGLKELRTQQVIEHPTSRHVFRLHPELEELYPRISDVDFDDDAIWAAWESRAGDAPSKNKTANAAFCGWGLRILSDRKRASVIKALALKMPRALAIQTCHELMAGPVDAVTGRSIEALKSLGLSPGVHERALYERLDPTQHNPYPACMLAEWLMEDGQVDAGMRLVHRFAAQRVSPGFFGNPFDDRYATLALRFAPVHAPRLVEQALLSPVPHSLKQLGALLSVLDAPWCREQLLRAAAAQTDPSSIRFLVGCLLHSNDAPTREAAQRLLPPPPTLSANQVGYTLEEVDYLNLREQVAHHRSRAQELADQLRPH